MFQERYSLKGLEVHCRALQWTSTFRLETSVYDYVKKAANAKGWRYIRVDTLNQQGFPDIILLRGREYFFVEGKLLKKAALRSIEDDLEWQFGQVGFMYRAISCGNPYVLAVAKGHTIAFLYGGSNESAYHPDFAQ